MTEDANARHQPVMLHECLEHLALRPGDAAVDGTLGYGGHSVAILDRIGREGRLLGLDQDPHALAAADARLAAHCEAQGWVPPYPTRGDITRALGSAWYSPVLFSPRTRRLVSLLKRFG